MLGSIFGRWKKKELASFDSRTTRERLIQNGRIAVIDDEHPLLIDELRRAGFSVDHDVSGDDLSKLDSQLYDVAIIDFHGVGRRLGESQGLDLLRHVRRVSPRTRLVAYTSRSLSAGESEFFRSNHVVLPKDLGLEESMAIVEEQLRLAFSKEHLFEALLAKLSVTDAGDRERVRDALAKALSNHDEPGFKSFLTGIAGQAAEKSVAFILDRLFSA